MPDTRISELAAATTLAGTEVVPVVQSATTKKATIAQVLAAAQPLDSDLTAIAALTTTAFGRSLLAVADAAAGRTTLNAEVAGAAAAAQAASQPLDSDLTAIAALTTTTFGRSLLALADSAALRAVLGTGTLDATTFLRGDGTWSVPAGGGGAPVAAPYVVTAADATLTGEKVLGADVIMRNTLANRPAAGVAGRLFDKTDSDQLVERDNGASWDTFAIKGLVVQDDNVEEGTGIRTLDFGTGLDVAVTGTEAVITAPGGTSAWEYLGSAVLSANANTVSAITVAARDVINIVVRIVGYDVADTPALRFNADSGTNYNSRHITFAAAGATGANTFNASDTMLKVAAGNSVRARHFVVGVSNRLGSAKAATIANSLGAASAASEPVVAMSSGGWFNTTDQITSVQLISVGANLLLAGTGLVIFGRNL